MPNDLPPWEIVYQQAQRWPPESGARAGYDGAKRKKGSKLHLAVDTLGHMLALHVTPASVGDRDAVGQMARNIQAATDESVEIAFVDQGYTGERAAAAAAGHGIELSVVKLPQAKRGFVLLPKREQGGARTADADPVVRRASRSGYVGGYDAVRRYARRWSQERGASTTSAYVPLSFSPGEAYQFDWSHEVILLSGVTVIVKVAHVRLCHSRMLFVRAYSRETQEMVFDAHDRAFALFKGTCRRGIYDNMKTAVETIFVGKGRLYNIRFLQMCSHYLVDPVACTPASGWEKGQVENQVGLVHERFFTPRPRFKTLDELNAWLLDKCIAYAKAHRHPEFADRTIWEVFEAERPRLVPYAGRFDGFHAVPASISKTCLVRFDNNKYLVAASAVGRPVEVQAYCGPHRNPPRRPDRCRASTIIWPRRGGLRSLALCACPDAQARRLAQRRAL
jgi:transposase